jgi:hypothetical protein
MTASETEWLVEVTAWDPVAGAETVLRFSKHGFVTAPTDTPANAHYDPCVETPANFGRFAFKSYATGGASDLSAGEIVLANADGHLDHLVGLGMDGRQTRILRGPRGAAYSEFTVWMTGTVEIAAPDWRKVTLTFRDWQARFDEQIQPTKYAGSNTGTGASMTGKEGTSDDIKDAPKPLCYGRVYNVPPVCVNTGKGIFQVHDGTVEAIDGVYDKGKELTWNGVDHASLAALEAASVAGGSYTTCLAEGLFKLGSVPAGTVTVDVEGDKTDGVYAETAAQIMQRVALTKVGLVAGDLDAAAFTALDAATSAPVGIYIVGEANSRAVLDALASSIGAWWGFNRQGKLQAKRLEAPSGEAAVSLTKVELLGREDGLSRVPSSTATLPAWQITVRWGRNWCPQDRSDLDATIEEGRKTWAAEEYRSAAAKDEAVKTVHILAQDLTVETMIAQQADAEAEAARLLALYKAERQMWVAKVPSEHVTGVDLGSIVEIKLPRFGMTDGKLFVVLGLEEDAGTGISELTVWG